MPGEEGSPFRPFTRESLAALDVHIAEEHVKKKKKLVKKRAEGEVLYDDKDKNESPQPDPNLEQGERLLARLRKTYPAELIATPIEDIDSFYHDQRTFVVINKAKDIFRFSATDAMWILDPFNPIRRLSIYIMVHPLFSLFIMTTLLVHCIFMTLPVTPIIKSTELILTGIFTFEIAVKVMALGFILQPFTYLRDSWNWLDFIVTGFAYLTVGIDLGNLSVLRAFRFLRALKTGSNAHGRKTIVRAALESLKNLRDVFVLAMFSLSVFALFGLQIYMGVLTQKCIRNFPNDDSWGNLTDENWFAFAINSSKYQLVAKENLSQYLKLLEKSSMKPGLMGIFQSYVCFCG